MTTLLQQLNNQFAIPNHISFTADSNNIPIANIANAHASATISLLGAHIKHYQPTNHQPVLWLSSIPVSPGNEVFGGVPVCWPWFCDHPTDPVKPSHGFARSKTWSLTNTTTTPNHATQLQFQLTHDDHSLSLFPHHFTLNIIFTIDQSLTIQLTTQNNSTAPFTISQALHSYFNVADSTAITIRGLENLTYLDEADNFKPKQQQNPIKISQETDRLFLDTTADTTIQDPILKRTIRVAKQGSRTTTVWNPWQKIATQLPTFDNQGYKNMVCVETVNAHNDSITIQHSQSHTITAAISLEPLT